VSCWEGAIVQFPLNQYRTTGGMYHMGARFYHHGLGRWISADSIVPDPANPQSFNRFSYGYNNPLKYRDPTGHQVLPPWWDPVAEISRRMTSYDSQGLPAPFEDLTTDIGKRYLEAISAFNQAAVPVVETALSFVPGYELASGVAGISGTGRRMSTGDRVGAIAFGLVDFTPLDEIAGATRGLLPAPRMHSHHIFPQKWAEWFADRGIDVHQYTIALESSEHLSGVHGKGGFVGSGDSVLPRRWNQFWDSFIEEHQLANSKDIYQFAGVLLDWFGLSGHPIVPYPKK